MPQEPLSEDEKHLTSEATPYSEYPPDIDEFILASNYTNLGGDPPIACQAVQDILLDIFAQPQQYNEVALLWGIGAGKSFLCSVAIAYMVFRTLCLRDPQAYYGLAPGSQITFANFSVSADQAARVVFNEVKQRIDNAPCFQWEGFERDKKITSELRWPEKGIAVMPGNSRETSALGLNILGAVVDEAAWLEVVERTVRQAGRSSGGEYDAAEELYSALVGRVGKRGNQNWRKHSLFFMISSPRYVDDFVSRKVREAETDLGIYARTLPSWEGASKLSLSGKTFSDKTCGEVPVEYTSEFERNPERARRDYGAVPSTAIDAYFSADKVAAVIDPDLRIPEHNSLPDWFVGKSGKQYCIHVDLALRWDAAGIAMAHAEGSKVIIDYVNAIKASDFAENEIDLESIRQLILTFRERGFHISQVTFDAYQSADSIQQLMQEGFRTDILSVDKNTEAYDLLKELIYTGRCALPNHPLLIQELCQLELIRGKKIDHPPRGSKDIADAVAGAVFNVYTTSMLGDVSFTFDGEAARPVQTDGENLAGIHVIDEGIFGETKEAAHGADELWQKIRERRKLG